MAGDWIKIEHTTPDKPEVIAMAELLKIDPDAVVGKLLRVWIWADLNSVNGVDLIVTDAFMDRLTHRKGFAAAMRTCGWLGGENGKLQFPNFDRHNGKTAKDRAETNRRVSNHRKRNADVTSVALQKPLPEKRREEKSKNQQQERTTLAEFDDDVVDDWSDSMTTDSAKRMEELQRRINALHPDWKKRPHFSAKELYALKDNAKAWLSVTPEDWNQLNAYMAARIPSDWKTDPRDFWQPDNRLALINAGATSILGVADKWVRTCAKKGVPTGLEPKKTA